MDGTRDTLSHHDIPWTPHGDHLDRLEACDPLTFTPTELLAYAADLQAETRWVRSLLHEALAQVARLTDQLERATRVVEYQRQQLRDQPRRAA
jgi:hypothetical protein